jgi:hypothetical protein
LIYYKVVSTQAGLSKVLALLISSTFGPRVAGNFAAGEGRHRNARENEGCRNQECNDHFTHVLFSPMILQV